MPGRRLCPRLKPGTIAGVAGLTSQLRAIPSVDRVLHTDAARSALGRFERGYVTATIRTLLDELRARLVAGSGALSLATLPTKVISIWHPERGAQEIARLFRQAEPPIIGRIHAGQFLLDLRRFRRSRT